MKRPNMCVLTFPISAAGVVPLSALLEILKPLSNNLYVITGNEGYASLKGKKGIHLIGVHHRSGSNALTRIIRYFITQLKMSRSIIKISPKVDFYIFFIGGASSVLPLLVVKLFKKKAMILLAGSDIKSGKFQNDAASAPIVLITNLSLALCDKIGVYTPRLINDYGLAHFSYKIVIVHHYFLDFNLFKPSSPFNTRKNTVGYVGRLSIEKGIMNFIQAISLVLKDRKETEFLIAGDGSCLKEVENMVSSLHLANNVKIVGWVSHELLPEVLNKLKLIVLPSYTEGLPNVMLEAMACGTPVLATAVGAIPDVIDDGKTGFLLENNSPECIAEKILFALSNPCLEQISNNAFFMVKDKFTFEKAVAGFRGILDKL